MQKTAISYLVLLLFSCQILVAQSAKWPKEIPLKTGGKIVIYQPQPDELNGNIMKGRSAISAKEKANDPMIYGAIFFDANLMTDKSTRMATLESLNITNVKMEGVDNAEKLQKVIELIESEVPKWNLDISLNQITATLQRKSGDGEMYNNTPPKIYYREKPTSLVILDGEPKIKKDKDLDAERVLNSPNLIFKEGNQWNMYNGGTWYKSFEVTSGWVAEKSMSAKVKSINEQIKKQEKEANDGKSPTGQPVVTDIIISTEPAELIQTEGTAVFKAIESTTLQYASNTKNDIIKTADGTIYILITGRWFKSSSLNGPWTFNGADKMPPEFAKIPAGSPKDNLLVSISGTPEAEEAIIDAEIPQTAKVDRKSAKVEVEYDGNPQFETINGTSLQLAENSNLTVIKDASGTYFALDNGVWFVSKSAKGPWAVADKRPEGLETIPASSPAYNTKFVYIYEVTKDYVVTGYTAGYLGSYIQGDPVVIFGTGFYYRPWYGSVYYPRPTTWGFSFSYNPWTGWTMGFGFNVGFLHIGFSTGPSYGYGGWFGPPYYRPPYRPPYYGGGYYGGRPGGGNNININTGGGDINIGGSHNNIYNRPGSNGNNNRAGISSRQSNTNNKPGSNYKPGSNNKSNTGNRSGNMNNNSNNRSSAKPSTSNQNNVFADKDGNVFQKDEKGNVNQRDNKSNGWKPTEKNSASANQINRYDQTRQRGNQQTNNFNNRTKPAAKPAAKPASRPAARSRGRRQ